MPADAVSKKKQKEIQKKAYDGRTKLEKPCIYEKNVRVKSKRERVLLESL